MLQTPTSVVLSASDPMLVTWRPAHRVLFNDGFSAIVGAKRASLPGQSLPSVWSEIVTKLSPLIARIDAGEALHSDDLTVMVELGDGSEEAQFAFSFMPVRDDEGGVRGM